MGSAHRAGWFRGEYYMPPAAAALPMAAKTYTTGLAPAGNAPLLVLRTTFLLKGSMSLDSQVALLPYESSSFATPEGELYLLINFYPHKQFKV